MDIRVDAPYAWYPSLQPNRVTHTRGDLEARFIVRINELFESYNLIRQLLDNLPEGELAVRVPRRIPAGEAISRVEAPRGELFYFLKSNGTEKPDRLKIRTPSLCNWASVIQLAVGHKLADMPMMLVGIDPCFSCNDRLITVKKPGSSSDQIWTWSDLRQYGIEYYR
jgi:ech hydrogenase subunit E